MVKAVDASKPPKSHIILSQVAIPPSYTIERAPPIAPLRQTVPAPDFAGAVGGMGCWCRAGLGLGASDSPR